MKEEEHGLFFEIKDAYPSYEIPDDAVLEESD